MKFFFKTEFLELKLRQERKQAWWKNEWDVSYRFMTVENNVRTLSEAGMDILIFFIFSFCHWSSFHSCWLSKYLPLLMRAVRLHQKQLRISHFGGVVRTGFGRNYDLLTWEQHGKIRSYSPPRLERGCPWHQPVLHPPAPAGDVAAPVSASPAIPQPWHLERSGLACEEKTSVKSE